MAIVVRREKAKEEHGSFYKMSMGRFLSKRANLSTMPKPNAALFINTTIILGHKEMHIVSSHLRWNVGLSHQVIRNSVTEYGEIFLPLSLV